MDLEMSKTQDALRLMREKEMTPYAAAKEAGITPTTLYAAIKREEAKGVLAGLPLLRLPGAVREDQPGCAEGLIYQSTLINI